jgi:histidinol-phosphate aminotransferase
MRYLNKYLRNLSPYKVASHKIWDVPEADRPGILKLDWNEATIAPSPLVKKRLTELIQGPEFYYLYPSTYNPDLHKLLMQYTNMPEENIQYFASSDSLHEYITRVFVSVGDPVLILGPTYDNFRLACESQGARIEYSNLSETFIFDAQKFEADIQRVCPSLIYICNPNNPTGTFIEVDYIKSLLQRFPESLFLIDEAYYEFSGKSAKDLVLEYDNILVTRTLSKAFALANFRMGYLISCKENISNISKVRNPKNITTFSQEAAIAVLTDIAYMQQYVAEVKEAKRWFIKMLSEYPEKLKPFTGEGNFVLIKFKDTLTRDRFIEFMESSNILIRNLTHSILLKDCVRITIGTREQMKYTGSFIQKYFAGKHEKISTV